MSRLVTPADVRVSRRPRGAVVVLRCNGQELAELVRRGRPGSHAPHNWGVPLLSGDTRWFHHCGAAVAFVCSRFELKEPADE